MNSRPKLPSIRNGPINAGIIMVVLLGIGNFIPRAGHFLKPLNRLEMPFSFFSPQMISFHRSFSTIIGIILLFVSYRLYKRIRMAWVITVCVLPLSALLHLFALNGHITIQVVLEILLELLFIVYRKEFSREADPINLKWGILLGIGSILLVIIITAVELFILRFHFRGIGDFIDAFVNSLQLLFFMKVSVVEPKTMRGVLLAHSAIILYWASVNAALFFILKPLVYQPIVSKFDKEKVRAFLNLYGDNPISYVDIENDKKYFFGSTVEGFIAYVRAGRVVVCSGDPICKISDAVLLVSEFMNFCRSNDYDICFCQISAPFLECFRMLGFGIAKYGEEAMFDFETYSLKGKQTAKIRQNIHHADREGIKVFEYKPYVRRDRKTEDEIYQVSKEWLTIKKSGELSFLLGSIALNKPLDRRYFFAADKNGKVCAFIVFVPFMGGKGYYTDVTRRLNAAPIGVMEKIVITAFETMKGEGVKWGSLGVAPLCNIGDDEQTTPVVNKLLNYVFEHMNGFYGFKTLYQYKKKYAPTVWEPRYLTYYPNIFSPQIAYAIIKAQNSGGVKDFLVNRIKNMLVRFVGYYKKH